MDMCVSIIQCDSDCYRDKTTIHLSYSILTSKKFHNFKFAGNKQMTDSNRLTLVLFDYCNCLRVPPCIRIYYQFLHSKPRFIPSSAFEFS